MNKRTVDIIIMVLILTILVLTIPVSADDNITIINQTIIINNTYCINQTINQTIVVNNTYFVSQNNTYNFNNSNVSFYYNVTNVTNYAICNNCSYYINGTNSSYFYNISQIDEKLNSITANINNVDVKLPNYLLKSDYLINNSTDANYHVSSGTLFIMWVVIIISVIMNVVILFMALKERGS